MNTKQILASIDRKFGIIYLQDDFLHVNVVESK